MEKRKSVVRTLDYGGIHVPWQELCRPDGLLDDQCTGRSEAAGAGETQDFPTISDRHEKSNRCHLLNLLKRKGRYLCFDGQVERMPSMNRFCRTACETSQGGALSELYVLRTVYKASSPYRT